MKLRLVSIGFVLGVGASLLGSAALSQDKGATVAPPDLQDPTKAPMQDPMQEWMNSIKPGAGHKLMEPSIGVWETTTKIWMGGPGQDPVETHGTAERKWVLDGRFVLEELKSEFPLAAMTGGQAKNIPWTGMGMFGYDNVRNMYVGCWADTMGTQLLTMKGSSADGKTFTYYGEMDEPSLGVFGRTVKYQTKTVDADTMVFEITDLHAGDNYKVVEVTYKRKK